jgi:hypothetical protein
VLGFEFGVTGGRIRRHAEDRGAGFLELRFERVEVDRLLGAARRVVLRIEIEDELFSIKGLQGSDPSAIIGQLEIGGFITGARFLAHVRLPFVSMSGDSLRHDPQKRPPILRKVMR